METMLSVSILIIGTSPAFIGNQIQAICTTVLHANAEGVGVYPKGWTKRYLKEKILPFLLHPASLYCVHWQHIIGGYYLGDSRLCLISLSNLFFFTVASDN